MEYILTLNLVWCGFMFCQGALKEYVFPTQAACEAAIPEYKEFFGEDVVRKAKCLPGSVWRGEDK